jgi:NIMA (never in mitosis gene a)-related kinase
MKALGTKEKNNALNEIRLLACLSSPYIIGYCESFFDEKLDVLTIAMEYANEGDLLKKI